MNITFRFNPPLEPRIADYRRFVESGFYEHMNVLAHDANDVLLEALQTEAPVNKNPSSNSDRAPGTFRDSIHAEEWNEVGHTVFKYMAEDPIATFIIKGTDAHEIVPVMAKALAFYTAGGELVFTRHVDHPGTEPNDFVGAAWDGSGDQIRALLSQAAQNMIEEITR